jgi:signal transduction histidine kinase
MKQASVQRGRATFGLSARLLLLTVFFVMLAELLIFVPSISRFRHVWLHDTITRAHLATLALDMQPEPATLEPLQQKLLDSVGAHGIVLHMGERRLLAISSQMPPMVDYTVDLRRATAPRLVMDAIDVLVTAQPRVVRVLGHPDVPSPPLFEVVFDEAPLRAEMLAYAGRILQLSVVISLLTAGLVYISLHWMIVRPLRRVTGAMTAFRENPEDAGRVVAPTSRGDEIGVAQRELARMQNELRAALRQKTRLAALGAAVAKINHDLRNTLATAVLVSDRLADIDDPEVKRVTPRLFEAIDRAVNLCSQSLGFVGDSLPAVHVSRFALAGLIDEVAETANWPAAETAAATTAAAAGAFAAGAADDDEPAAAPHAAWAGGRIDNRVPRTLEIAADRDQLYRSFSNLVRNAYQAGAHVVSISAEASGEKVVIDVADDGPGLSPRARERLFQPFAGSARMGSTGLGLVIVRDIARAHGGDVHLRESAATGATFRLELPARA